MQNRSKYSDLELKHALSDVFASVYFVDKRAKKRLSDSYFLNFDNLIAYARANNIDEMQYIRSIQQCLLKIPKTYLARPFYTKYELKFALTKVFESVYFEDPFAKINIRDSYFLNFDSFMGYAEKHRIDPMSYVTDIRDMLLELPGCHERT
jgi:hypothetical protein